jgi:signal transduction histidine kinase
MTMVTEPERLELHQAMRGIIGPGAANTFMDLAAPRDWDDVVRVHHLDAAINGSRAELRQETAGLKAELKQDINNLRVELKQDISDVRVEIAQLRTEFTALLASELRNQTKWIIGVLTTLCVALIVSVL